MRLKVFLVYLLIGNAVAMAAMEYYGHRAHTLAHAWTNTAIAQFLVLAWPGVAMSMLTTPRRAGGKVREPARWVLAGRGSQP